MYSEKITLFNLHRSSLGDMWYPHVIDCNLLIDKAAITAKYGAESKDNAILNIRYHAIDDVVMIGEKRYLPPKEWERQTDNELAESITFASGERYSFFMLGEYPDAGPITDEDFDGFFDYIKENYDFVFAVTSMAKYNAIPHFEITGK